MRMVAVRTGTLRVDFKSTGCTLTVTLTAFGLQSPQICGQICPRL
jgi:hypothetical protein